VHFAAPNLINSSTATNNFFAFQKQIGSKTPFTPNMPKLESLSKIGGQLVERPTTEIRTQQKLTLLYLLNGNKEDTTRWPPRSSLLYFD
jgi:hypothetical protein